MRQFVQIIVIPMRAFEAIRSGVERVISPFLLSIKPIIGLARAVGSHLVLFLDCSSSMSGKKFDQTIEAATSLVPRLRPEDELTVYSFASKGQHQEVCHIRGGNPVEAQHATQQLQQLRASGNTYLSGAILDAERQPAECG